jgi:ankyrin repeat protein
MIKYWRDDDTELYLRNLVRSLVDSGSEINMRDRCGNTPLAAATARGFRGVVQELLDRGGNVHNRNYTGDGIIIQALRWKQSAKKEGNYKLHARIWSSLLLLLDYGAKHDPTDFDEWMSQHGKEEFSKWVSATPERFGTAPISISKRV